MADLSWTYRRLLVPALIFCMLGSGSWLAPSVCRAEGTTTETDWPDQIYFRQSLPKPPAPITNKPAQAEPGSFTGSIGSITLEPSKKEKKAQKAKEKKEEKKQKRGKKDNSPGLTDEQITQVGPKEPPPIPDPLLRLGVSIVSDKGIIPSGFYLVRPVLPQPEGLDKKQRILMLSRQNKTLIQFSVQEVDAPDENKAIMGTSSPITSTAPQVPPGVKVEALLSPDQKSLIIVVKEGKYRFESAPFPIATDLRHILTY